MNTALTALLVFASVTAGDWVWARYAIAVQGRHALKASAMAVGIILVGAVSTVAYVEDHRMVVPAVLGAFVGTYFTVRRSRPEPQDPAVLMAQLLEIYGKDSSEHSVL